MIKFIYSTDLHGNYKKYEDVFSFAIKHDIKLIHLGADTLPKGPGLLNIQEKFVKSYLRNFFINCQEKGIKILASFGNDDLYSRKKYFRRYASLLDEIPYNLSGYTFKSYPFVLDYPFGLKTACKLDYIGWKCPDPYIGTPCDYHDSERYPIIDINDYFSKKGTIEEDLKNIPADNKTIMAIHQPPNAMGLDVCADLRRVGSKSVYDWILREKPLLVLSGHIHESFEMTDIWKVELKGTTIIQPGQDRSKTTMVYIEIIDNKVSAQIILN
jgi:Icc-related predicted phosphoesterase